MVVNPNSNTAMISNMLFLLISILLLQCLRNSLADETNYIDKICNMTPLPDNCKLLLLTDPRAPQAATLKDLTLIALDMTITGALTVNRKAADLARQYRGAPLEEPLSQCEQIYIDLITGLQEVMDNVRSSSFRNLYEIVNAAAQKPVDCENEFASRGLDSPLIQDDTDLEQKVTLSANLARLIKKFLGD